MSGERLQTGNSAISDLLDLERARRREAEAALREVEAQLTKERAFRQSLLESVPGILVVFRQDEGKPLIWNRRVLEVLGLSGEAYGRSRALAHILCDDRALAEEAVQTTLQGGRGEAELTLTTRAGERIPCLFNAHALDLDGEPAVLAIGLDISAQKEAERLVRIQHRLAETLGSSHGVERGLELCLEAAMEATRLDCGGIYLVDEQTGNLECVLHRGLGAEFAAQAARFDADSDRTRLVMTGRPHVARYAELGLAASEVVRREGLRFLAVLPLLHEGRVLGCVNVGSHVLDDIPQVQRQAAETIAASVGSTLVRLRAEEALRAAEVSTRLLLDHLPTGVFQYGLDSVIRYCNERLSEILGVPREKLLGLDLRTLADRRPQEALQAPLDGREGRYQGPYLSTFSGREIHASMVCSPSFGPDGRLNGAVAILEDVTARHQAEVALRESEEKHRFFVEAANDAVMIHAALDDGRPGPIFLVNELACEQFGYTREEFARLTPAELNDRDHLTHIGVVMEQLRREGRAVFETVMLHKNGRRVPVEVSARMMRRRDSDYIVSLVRDVTARQAAEAALRQSERNYRLLLENSPDIVVVATPEGRILFANDTFERKLGYGAEERARMHLLDVHQEASRREAEQILSAIVRGERQSCPLPLVTKSGDQVPVETRAWIGQWNGADCVFGLLKDLSAEQEAQQRFERIFHANPALMALGDAEHRFTDVNAAWLKTLGYADDEVIGRTPAELGLFVHPERQAEAGRALGSTGRIENVEMQVRCKDGTILDGLFSGEKITSQGTTHFLTIMVDITERRKIERAYRSKSEFLARLVENAAEGICVCQACDGFPYLRFDLWNDRMTEITGFSREEINQVGWYQAMYPDRDLQARAVARMERMREGDNLKAEEWQITTRTGEKRTLAISTSLMPLDDGSPAVVALMHDITERKEAEQAIQRMNAELERRVAERTEELAATNRELESFAYSVSHDLRTPLRAIDGFSQVVVEDYGDRLDEDGRGFLQQVRRASQRMGVLIDDMLALSRLGRAELLRQEVDLSALARSVIADLRRQDGDRVIEVAVEDGLRANGDPRLLQVVLTNLLGNAWKFTTATVSPRIEMGCREHDGRLAYFVRDNGAGFDMAYAHKLFGAFQRLHDADEFEGTGIGLATVQRVVHRHGGRVWAHGEVGKGAIFHFTLGETAR